MAGAASQPDAVQPGLHLFGQVADNAQPGTKPTSPEASFASVHADDITRVRQAFEAAIASGEGFALDHRIGLADGGQRHVQQQVEVIERDAQGRALRLAGAVHDITRRKDAESQIRRLAYYDPLTGLPNRLLFTEQLVVRSANEVTNEIDAFVRQARRKPQP